MKNKQSFYVECPFCGSDHSHILPPKVNRKDRCGILRQSDEVEYYDTTKDLSHITPSNSMLSSEQFKFKKSRALWLNTSKGCNRGLINDLIEDGADPNFIAFSKSILYNHIFSHHISDMEITLDHGATLDPTLVISSDQNRHLVPLLGIWENVHRILDSWRSPSNKSIRELVTNFVSSRLSLPLLTNIFRDIIRPDDPTINRLDVVTKEFIILSLKNRFELDPHVHVYLSTLSSSSNTMNSPIIYKKGQLVDVPFTIVTHHVLSHTGEIKTGIPLSKVNSFYRPAIVLDHALDYKFQSIIIRVRPFPDGLSTEDEWIYQDNVRVRPSIFYKRTHPVSYNATIYDRLRSLMTIHELDQILSDRRHVLVEMFQDPDSSLSSLLINVLWVLVVEYCY